MSEPAAILASAFLAAYRARAESYDPATEQHRLSISDAVAGAEVAAVLRQPLETLLASERGDEIYGWAQEVLRRAGRTE